MASYVAFYHCVDPYRGFHWIRDIHSIEADNLEAAVRKAQTLGRREDDEDWYKISLVRVKLDEVMQQEIKLH